MNNLNNKKILLIICGGIAAYKSLEIIRLLKKSGVIIKTILTKSGAEFVTPLSITSLSKSKVYQDLFSIEDEAEMDHISLSRWADLILIAPATANTISKLANGNSDDLASTVALASNKKISQNGKRINQESNNVVKALQEGLGGIRDVIINNVEDVYCKIYRLADVPMRKAMASNSFLAQSPRFVVEAIGLKYQGSRYT